jgi:nitrile hydratase accessory protein
MSDEASLKVPSGEAPDPSRPLSGAHSGELAEPVFSAPWEARSFAMAVELSARGAFTWAEWTEALAAEIACPDAAGAPRPYFECWLGALETLATGRGLTSADHLSRRQEAWRLAQLATPHGAPVEPPAGE